MPVDQLGTLSWHQEGRCWLEAGGPAPTPCGHLTGCSGFLLLRSLFPLEKRGRFPPDLVQFAHFIVPAQSGSHLLAGCQPLMSHGHAACPEIPRRVSSSGCLSTQSPVPGASVVCRLPEDKKLVAPKRTQASWATRDGTPLFLIIVF